MTEYLWENGWHNFTHWVDYQAWYPLGCPVSTIIYPGMQVTAMLIKMWILPEWSMYNICCRIPAWFGVLSTLEVAWLTFNCVTQALKYKCVLQDVPILNTIYQNVVVKHWQNFLGALIDGTCSDWGLSTLTFHHHTLTPLCYAVALAAMMSIVPAHLLQSYSSFYKDESVAMTGVVLTFVCWIKSVHSLAGFYNPTIAWAFLTALAYFYVAASCQHHFCVLNLINLHAALLVLIGHFSHQLYLLYTIYYACWTLLAIQIFMVGWAPLTSLEQ